MVRNGISRDALGMCLPRPQGAYVPVAWDLWELKQTPGRKQDVSAEGWMMWWGMQAPGSSERQSGRKDSFQNLPEVCSEGN